MMTANRDKAKNRNSKKKFRKLDRKRLKKSFLLAILFHIIILYAVFPGATPNRIILKKNNLMKISTLPKKVVKKQQKKKRKKNQ